MSSSVGSTQAPQAPRNLQQAYNMMIQAYSTFLTLKGDTTINMNALHTNVDVAHAINTINEKYNVTFGDVMGGQLQVGGKRNRNRNRNRTRTRMRKSRRN